MPDLDVVFHERTLGLRLEWEAPNLTFDTVRCIVVSDNQGRIPAGSVLLRVNGIEPQVRPRNVTVSYATFLDSLRDMPRPLTVTFRVQDDWKTLANATAARQTARADAPHRKRILEETKSERAEANAARLGSNAYHASIFAAAAPARPAHPAAAAAPARPAHPVALAAGAAARPAQPAPSAVADPVRPAHPAAPAAAPPARPTHPAGSAPPAWPAHPVAPAAAPPARPVHPAASAPPARPAHPAAPTAAPTAAPPARPAHPAAPAAAAPARSTHPAAHAAAATARPVQPAAFAPPTRSAHPAPSAAGVAARPGSAPPVGDGWLEPRFGPTGKVSSPAEAYTARPANATRLAPGAALAKSRIPRGTRYESAPPPPVLRGFATASLPASPGSTSALKVPLRLAVGQAPPRPAVRPTNFDRPALLTKDAREDSGSRVGAAPQSLQTFFVEPVNVLVEPANVRPPPPQPAPRAQPQPQQRPQAQEPQEPQSQPAQPQSRPAQQPAQPQARQTQPQSLPAQSQSRPAQSQPAPRPAQPQAQPAQPQSMPAQPPARPQSQPAAQPQRPQPAAQTSRPAAQAQSSPAAQMQRPQASQPARCRPLPQRKKVSMLSHPAPPRLAAGATSPTSPTPTSDSEKGFLAVSSNESLSRPPRNRDDESMGESSSDDDGAAVHLKRVQERFSHVAER
ncbi:hypothetical protein M885DRAFT_556448 [Pelagophyceae sp. CCMP2097]|nr:hypothetical protein M885DRAFT_556448 [Pelagophyceae sp. CCMP2097]